jgi:hypothetical protein
LVSGLKVAEITLYVLAGSATWPLAASASGVYKRAPQELHVVPALRRLDGAMVKLLPQVVDVQPERLNWRWPEQSHRRGRRSSSGTVHRAV